MPFTCEDSKTRWPEYVYRELDEHEQALFVHHLQQCESCRRDATEWEGLLTRFDTFAASDQSDRAPQDLVYRVKRQIQLYQDWRQQSIAVFRLKLAGAIAACFLVFGGLWLANQTFHTLTPPQRYWDRLSDSILHDLYSRDSLEIYRQNGIYLTTPAESDLVTVQSPPPLLEKQNPKGTTPSPSDRG